MIIKTNKISFLYILTFLLLLLISHPFAPGCPLYNGEIMCEVIGLSSPYDTYIWTVNASSLSSIRWWYIGATGEYPITSGYSSASVSGTGNTYCMVGFSSPHSPDSQHDLAYGKYQFTFDLPGPYWSHSIELDLRDGDWSAGYDVGDFWIRCHVTSTSSAYFEWKQGQGGTYSSNMKDTIWEMAGIDNGDENKEVFQPTKPRNFECINKYEPGQNPILDWDPPSEPAIDSTSFRYKLYKQVGMGSPSCAASNLTTTTWTDQSVVIGSPGSKYTYWATAYTTSSSESPQSKFAFCYANPYKRLAEEPENDFYLQKNDNNLELIACPNPFNPSTNISYYLLRDGFVQLAVYNISGQKIAELVNEHKYAGEYNVNLDGQFLAGGIYVLRLQLADKIITRKILLFK